MLFLGLSSVFLNSCLEKYLDKAPESGLSEKEVFTKYSNFYSYLDGMYYGNAEFKLQEVYPLYFIQWGQKMTWEMFTDMSDAGRRSTAQPIKGGLIADQLFKFCNDGAYRPILNSMFIVIRKCNTTLQNIGLLQDAKQEDIDDFIAQAHLARAFAHFELVRIWGGMPYITKVIGPDDQWDIPRLSRHETLVRIAADMDTAAIFFEKAGRMRRDLGPGQVGHLSSPQQDKPNGVAAKALKGRALLYAASPLNNENGVADWEAAAKANWEAIQIAEQYQYALLNAVDYKKNFIGTTYTNEQIWGYYGGTKNYQGSPAIMNAVFTGQKGTGVMGECPTQNTVDKFETKWGDPLNTQAERDAAAALGHYNEQNPYKDRDPRFYIDIIYNTAPIVGFGTAKIYYEMISGQPVYSELLDRNYVAIISTGYGNRKRWGEQSVKNKTTPQYTDPIIRLGELYLNYAEAANEAYGPNTAAPNSSMTAVQAINMIRNRIGQPDVLAQFKADKDIFRSRIKNERTIELCFEGHYFLDIRRWKDAPVVMAGPVIGIDVEKVPVNTTYPTGYKYTRQPLPEDRQSHWKEAMYFLPFPTDDSFKMKNFLPNELW